DAANDSETVNLTQSGGRLGGSGTLSVSGTFDWSGGEQSDTGKTVLASGGALSITGANVRLGDTSKVERTLQIASGATATIEPGANFVMYPTTKVENAGSFNANGNEGTADAIYVGSETAGQLFHNTGTFTRSGSGAFKVQVPLENDKAVTASTGTLSLEGGGGEGVGTGSFSAASGANVDFRGGAFSLSGTTTSGAGTITVSGATVDFDGEYNVGGTT